MAQDTIDRLLHDIPECASGRALKECETLGLGIIGSDRAGESFPNHPIIALPRIRLLDVVLLLLYLKTFPIRAGIVVGAKFERIGVTLREEYGLPKDVAYHLVSNYGTRGEQCISVLLQTFHDSGFCH